MSQHYLGIFIPRAFETQHQRCDAPPPVFSTLLKCNTEGKLLELYLWHVVLTQKPLSIPSQAIFKLGIFTLVFENKFLG